MITFNTLIATLLLSITPTNLGSNGAFNNNFNFSYKLLLPSTTCVDDNDNLYNIVSSMQVDGLLQFNDNIRGSVNLEFQNWVFRYTIQECLYDNVHESYYYSDLEGFSSSFTFNYSTWFNYDGYAFDNLENFHINYYFDNQNDDLYQNVHIYTEESAGQLAYSDISTGGQGYDFIKFSNAFDLSFDYSYLARQVSDFLNGQVGGGVDYERGYRDGQEDGYNAGYNDGYNEGFTADVTAVTIFNGILNIGLVPINFFLGIFNYEILGINVSSFVSALLSVALIIIVVRMVTGKKNE